MDELSGLVGRFQEAAENPLEETPGIVEICRSIARR
jgi:hypothetical protein